QAGQRRLAAARAPEDAEDAARGHAERNVPERELAISSSVVAEGNAVELDGQRPPRQRRAGAGREAGLDRAKLLDARDARDRLLHVLELMAKLLDRPAEHVRVLEQEEHRP